MRIVLQKVAKASVSVNSKVVGAIEHGLCLLIGINRYDTLEDAQQLVKKVLKMRLWREKESHWQKNVVDVQGGILAISQFTLYANTDKGAKPDFHGAMKTEEARKMFNQIVDLFRDAYPQGKIETGAFGEFMDVEIHNDGPTTLVLETKINGKPQLQ